MDIFCLMLFWDYFLGVTLYWLFVEVQPGGIPLGTTQRSRENGMSALLNKTICQSITAINVGYSENLSLQSC